MVVRKEPGKKLLQSENAVQQERAGKAKENKTRRILFAGHLYIWIYESDAIDQPLNRKTKTINRGPLPGKDPFHVPAQGLHQGGDDDHKQHVLHCAIEIHDLLTSSTTQASSKQLMDPESARSPLA